MRVALYARVSTQRQQQSQSIEQQVSRLREAVKDNPEWCLSEQRIYLDDGHSGARFSRPGLDRLRDSASLAEYDLVLCTTPDRLARKYVHQILIIEELRDKGCEVHFLDRPMESNDPHDQLLLQVRGAVAEYERSLIVERMRRGRHARLRSGTLLPWSRAPYGYVLDPEHPRDPAKVTIDPVASVVIKEIFEQYTALEPCSLYAMAKGLTEKSIPTARGKARWNVASVRGILRNQSYTGTAYCLRWYQVPAEKRKSAMLPVPKIGSMTNRPRPKDEWIGVTIPAIIDEDLFARAQQRLDENRQYSLRNTRHEYLLRGLVSCAQCRLSCGCRGQGKYHYYICQGHTDHLRKAEGERCSARFIPAEQLDSLVWEDLCQVVTNSDIVAHELQRANSGEWLPSVLQNRKKTVEEAIARLKRQEEKLLDIYLAEVISRDSYTDKLAALQNTRTGLEKQAKELLAQANKQMELSKVNLGVEKFCSTVKSTLGDLSFEQRQMLLKLLIDRVIVDDEKVEVRYVIPISEKGSKVPFCHLRLDHFYLPPFQIILNSMFRVGLTNKSHKAFFRPGCSEINRVSPYLTRFA